MRAPGKWTDEREAEHRRFLRAVKEAAKRKAWEEVLDITDEANRYFLDARAWPPRYEFYVCLRYDAIVEMSKERGVLPK